MVVFLTRKLDRAAEPAGSAGRTARPSDASDDALFEKMEIFRNLPGGPWGAWSGAVLVSRSPSVDELGVFAVARIRVEAGSGREGPGEGRPGSNNSWSEVDFGRRV